MNLGIIGVGNMGRAFAEIYLRSNFRDNLYLFDPNEEKLDSFREAGGVFCKKNLDVSILDCDYLLLAVKPQSFPQLASSLNKFSLQGITMISIMAGIESGRIKEALSLPRLVRAMPNLPLAVGKGLNAYFLSGEFALAEERALTDFWTVYGRSMRVDSELALDKITALSGSGPAYFYALVLAMNKKALEMGFSLEDAKKIAEQTFIGSAEFFAHSGADVSQMLDAVASKGGTTEAALKVLATEGFDTIISRAIEAAFMRSQQLK